MVPGSSGPLTAIDRHFAPAVLPGLLSTVIDGERITILRPFGIPLVLNETASAIWDRLDGVTTIGEMADEVADATGLAAELLVAQLVEVVASFRDSNLLATEERPADLVAEMPRTETPPIQPVAALDLLDLDGQRLDRAAFAGRPMAFVNWGSSCGFCRLILPALNELAPALRHQATCVVFVADGTAEANEQLRGIAAAAGGLAVLKRADLDPFSGLGTPIGVQTNAEGVIVGDPATGALEVVQLLAGLAGVATPTIEGLASGGMCGPGAKSSGVAWGRVRTCMVGGAPFTARTTSPASQLLLERVLPGPWTDTPEQPHDVIVTFAAEGSTALSRVTRSEFEVVRTRSRRRAVQGLLQYLAATRTPVDKDELEVFAPAVVRDGVATVLPGSLLRAVAKFQSMFEAQGFVRIDAMSLRIDPEAAEIVVPSPEFPYDESFVTGPTDGDDLCATGIAPGRYPIGAWIVPGEVPAVASRANLVGMVWRDAVPYDGVRTLHMLADVVRRVPLVGSAGEDPPSVLQALLASQLTSSRTG